jgi:hypothetical protein
METHQRSVAPSPIANLQCQGAKNLIVKLRGMSTNHVYLPDETLIFDFDRTHRLRKEGYIKALEDEVIRLKEVYSDSRQGRDKLAEENKQLRDALAQYGIPVGSPGSTASYAPGSSSTRTPPFTTQTTTPSIGSSGHASPGDRQQVSGHQLRDMTQQASGRGVDVEQAGIDFVLAYGNPPPNSKGYLSSPPQ